MYSTGVGKKNHPPCHEGRRVVTLKQPVARVWPFSQPLNVYTHRILNWMLLKAESERLKAFVKGLAIF
jgi:hypothetical protein